MVYLHFKALFSYPQSKALPQQHSLILFGHTSLPAIKVELGHQGQVLSGESLSRNTKKNALLFLYFLLVLLVVVVVVVVLVVIVVVFSIISIIITPAACRNANDHPLLHWMCLDCPDSMTQFQNFNWGVCRISVIKKSFGQACLQFSYFHIPPLLPHFYFKSFLVITQAGRTGEDGENAAAI